MEYVTQSLTGNEKVVMIGRFHWIYFMGAVFWIVLGVGLCIAIIGGGIAWDVNSGIKAAYPNLPDEMFWRGWADVVAKKGGYIAIIRDMHMFIRGAAFIALVLGIILFAHMMMVRATTEVAVTSSRLVLKEGIVSRNVDEMSVDRIESVHVIQSILGRIFNFGTVMVRGMGIGEIVLPPLANPVAFRNALEKARQAHDKLARKG
ncbi:MAG: PH domain-containing protein [Alphaproteobacteria bacterium]|nr:PH domain-containing protein [Alphaproteobacteria bacterium]